MQKTEVEIKRELAEKIGPELKALIKKYGFEFVNYTWQKVIEKQRQIAKAEVEVRAAQEKVEYLKRSLND